MFINVTPHALSIKRKDGSFATIEPSGTVARCKAESEVVAVIDGVEISKTRFGAVEDLPEPQDGIIFIASLLVAQAASRAGRDDVVSPGSLIRDEKGNPVGANGLSTH